MSAKTEATAAERIASYVYAHYSNMKDASRAIGCDYYQLWYAATGRVKRPHPDCLRALVKHSGQSSDYWLYGDNDNTDAR